MRRSALRFGRNTPGPVLPVGAPPSRASSGGRLAPTGRTGRSRRSPGFHHRPLPVPLGATRTGGSDLPPVYLRYTARTSVTATPAVVQHGGNLHPFHRACDLRSPDFPTPPSQVPLDLRGVRQRTDIQERAADRRRGSLGLNLRGRKPLPPCVVTLSRYPERPGHCRYGPACPLRHHETVGPDPIQGRLRQRIPPFRRDLRAVRTAPAFTGSVLFGVLRGNLPTARSVARLPPSARPGGARTLGRSGGRPVPSRGQPVSTVRPTCSG